MAVARTRAIALLGVEGAVVDVEATVTPSSRRSVPGVHLVGVPEAALSETRDRIHAALTNADQSWPPHATVSLYPAELPKRGCGFDLAIAVALLAANAALPADACAGAAASSSAVSCGCAPRNS